MFEKKTHQPSINDLQQSSSPVEKALLRKVSLPFGKYGKVGREEGLKTEWQEHGAAYSELAKLPERIQAVVAKSLQHGGANPERILESARNGQIIPSAIPLPDKISLGYVPTRELQHSNGVEIVPDREGRVMPDFSTFKGSDNPVAKALFDASNQEVFVQRKWREANPRSEELRGEEWRGTRVSASALAWEEHGSSIGKLLDMNRETQNRVMALPGASEALLRNPRGLLEQAQGIDKVVSNPVSRAFHAMLGNGVKQAVADAGQVLKQYSSATQPSPQGSVRSAVPTISAPNQGGQSKSR